MKYQHKNRRKFYLGVHVVLVTKYRKALFVSRMSDALKQVVYDISKEHGYDIIAMETDKDHIHILLTYDATEKVCDIIKIIKQETTHRLWKMFPSYLSKRYWGKKTLWSDGYFVCSVGETTVDTVTRYIRSQGRDK